MLQITKLQKLTLISSLILNHLSDYGFLPCITTPMQAVTDDGWQRYSLVFPKAKKGDHAIRHIITQASRGGYDVDGAWELEGALFCLWLDTIKQLAFFSQPNFGDMKSNEFKIHLIKHKELTIMHSTLQITATALSQIYLQSMRQIQGSSRST